MADHDAERNDSGSKDRATVALVDAKVDGLKELIRAEFATVKEDVRSLGAVVGDVIRLGVKVDDQERRLMRLEEGNAGADHERRIKAIEARDGGDRDYRRIHLPSLVIAGVVALGSIITTIVTQIHG